MEKNFNDMKINEKEAQRLQRMRTEHSELLDRYLKLERFTLTEDFLALSKKAQDKLRQQGTLMYLYLNVLRSRIMDCVNGEKEEEPQQEQGKEMNFEGWTVEKPHRCDQCKFEDNRECKKLILADGSHICLAPPIKF